MTKTIKNYIIPILGLFSILLLLFSLVFFTIFSYKKIIEPTRVEIGQDRLEPRKDLKIENGLPENNIKKASLLFFGDLMLDRHVKERIEEKSFGWLFEKISSQLIEKDLVGANLEGAVTQNGDHYLPQNLYDFAFYPTQIDGLADSRFTFFNLANNHFADQGKRGMEETREILGEKRIIYSGCNDGTVSSCSATSSKIGDFNVGLLGYSMVYNIFDREKAIEQIRESKKTNDFVIINIHWGKEYEHSYNKVQENLAHSMIDAGADIIIGHHPHVIQGIEIYNNRPIFYSLGNFIFDQYFSSDTQEGIAINLSLELDKIKFKLIPLKSKQSQPYLADSVDSGKILNNIIFWSNLKENVDLKEIITLTF